jgi:hypothetical protein
MRWIDHLLLPGSTLALAVVTAGAAHAALGRRGAEQRHAAWLRIALESGLGLGLASSASTWIEGVAPRLWQRGWHAHFDLVPGRFGVRTGYAAALFLPLALWSVLLFASLASRHPRAATVSGQGGVGTRGWILAAAFPLVVPLLAALPHLGGGPGAFPAFGWSSLLVVLVSLVVFALPSRSEQPASIEPPLPPEDQGALVDWPEALRRRGIEVTPLVRWPARDRGEDAGDAAGSDLGARLARIGPRRIPAELAAAVDELLHGERAAAAHGSALVAFGSEDGGSLEVAAAAAAVTSERFLRRTLFVCRDGAAAIGGQLARFLPSPATSLVVLEQPGEIDERRRIWVASAEAFAESLLPLIARRRDLATDVRLVVWWDLHRFSGVSAANLWAVSHRLYRLLAHHAADVRTVAFAWRSPHAHAQVERYVQRLLPHTPPERRELEVAPSPRRRTQLQLLGSSERFFQLDPTVDRDRVHPLVAAARVSLEAGWPTHLALPPGAAAATVQPHAWSSAVEGRGGGTLAAQPAEAPVRLLAVEDGEALAIADAASGLGRAIEWNGDQHVGVTTDNAYVEHLVRGLAELPGGLPTASRRLVAAVGQPNLLRRHLLRALAELPDTGARLQGAFLAHEGALASVLAELHGQGDLGREEVRFLDGEGRLAHDFAYRSRRPPDGRPLPFDSAGGEPIEVRDATAASDAGGVVLRVDAERLPIKAYPHRVFTHDGRRYRVRGWRSVDEVQARGFVECELEGRLLSSVRVRRSALLGLPARAGTSIGPVARGLARQLATVTYQEWIGGVLLLSRQPSGRLAAQQRLLDRDLMLQLSTSALLLHFPAGTQRRELTALTESLRPMLTVHLGIDEDDVELVAFGGTAEEHAPSQGIALVELYPGGFGLLEPIAEDSEFLLELLQRARSWLAACGCAGSDGCEQCLRSVRSRATNGGRPASRAAALAALGRVLG